MRLRTAHVFAAVCVLLLAVTVSAYATDLAVNCNAKKNNSINAALATLSKQGPHTITVSGTCNEAVLIESFDTLTLVATPGASINDPTPFVPDDNDVVDIVASRLVTVEGFTINGGFTGIACFANSSCNLTSNTIQAASDFAVLVGRQSSALLLRNTIQNSAGGLSVIFGAEVVAFGGTVQNITSDPDVLGYPAVSVGSNSLLRVNRFQVSEGVFEVFTVQGNAFHGVSVDSNSTLDLRGDAANITGNGGDGINVGDGSMARVSGLNDITSNGVHGIHVGESSFVRIGGANISGNGGGDPGAQVACIGTFSNVRGGPGGIFNCNNP